MQFSGKQAVFHSFGQVALQLGRKEEKYKKITKESHKKVCNKRRQQSKACRKNKINAHVK